MPCSVSPTIEISGIVQIPIGRKGLAPDVDLRPAVMSFRRKVAAEREGVVHRHPRLLHRGRREGVSADNVAGRLNVRDVGLEVLVHQELAMLGQAHASILGLRAATLLRRPSATRSA
jgi:hypothetical protein